ncbi:MAG: hypothetical protein ACR2QK_03090 [Acidimicrobiales bacterium]
MAQPVGAGRPQDQETQSTGDSEPPVIDDAFAAYFRMSKRQLLESAGSESTIVQTGGAYLADRLPVPPIEAGPPDPVEPMIETFLIEGDGTVTATGTDRALIDGCMPMARSMVDVMTEAIDGFDIELDGPAYVTASLTPVDQVTTVPHFDDDQYFDRDGVGLVAIVASHGGPRIASEPIDHRRARPGLPLEVDQAVFDRFDAGRIAHNCGRADRVVVFPQFGQLHAGPVIDRSTTGAGRTLLVFRAATKPR